MSGCGLVAALLVSPLALAQTELRNDGFESGQSAGFQAGFASGEIGAARFLPAGQVQVQAVRLLFGGATSQQTITLRIWDDTAGTTSPGAELFSGDFQLTGSNSVIQELDLSASGVIVPGQFRVGIEFQHAGLPSIARDDDGSITPGKNFIKEQSIGWVASGLLGLTGDWVIRAMVSTPGGGSSSSAAVLSSSSAAGASSGTATASSAAGASSAAAASSAAPATSTAASTASSGPAPGSSVGGSSAAAGSSAVSSSSSSASSASSASPGSSGAADCAVNADCPVGNYCNTTQGRCTFDCREDTDCAAGQQCNSLGQCVDEPSTGDDDGGGGCGCGASGAPSVPGGVLWAGIAVAALWRRRRAAR